MPGDEELDRQIRSVEAHLNWLKQQRAGASDPAEVPATQPAESIVENEPPPQAGTPAMPTAETLSTQAKVGCVVGAVLLLLGFLLLVFVLPEFLYE